MRALPSRALVEERFSLEADGPRAVRERYLLDAKERQRPLSDDGNDSGSVAGPSRC